MRDKLKKAHRIVVKIGTSSLTYKTGRLNLSNLARLAWVLSDLRNQEKEIILVSSGAIGVGAQRLNLSERPRDTKGKQAASAVGQAVLMQIYQNLFMEYNQTVAQILLTKDILDDLIRKENAENTFNTLLSMGVIPIVNENDSVSTYEIEFSDNDTLSAYVATLVEADLLIILSDIEALYDNDPKYCEEAKKIPFVCEITDEILTIAGDATSSLGTGGMITKISAAKIVMENNIDMVIASGSNPNIINDILDGKEIGTYFSKNKPVNDERNQ